MGSKDCLGCGIQVRGENCTMTFKNLVFKKSLFKRYLSVTMAIVISGFVVISGTILMFVTKYWEEEKHNLLKSNANAVSRLISSNSRVVNNSLYIMDSITIHGFMSIFSSSINSDIFITNSKGETLLCSEGSMCKHFSSQVSSDVMDIALNGEYGGKNSLGIYDFDCYIVAVPITMNTKDGSVAFGAVFTATNMEYISVFRNDVLQMLVLASFIAFVISFSIMWVLSYNLVKPLKEISDASKGIAKGDFSKRVPVRRADEIGQLALSFNNMANSLSISEDMRRNFIANVSHELKTPMTTISGFIDGILDGTIPESKWMYYISIVSSETKRLSRLVTTMLNLSKIDSGSLRLSYQKFDISSIIFKALLSFETKIENKRLEIRGLEDLESLYISADPDMIHQVLYNLVENAVKFTNEGGYIEIKLCKLKDKAMISVQNSGQGISQDDLKFVFDKFFKTDKSRSQDKYGMGLGLYIVKTIVDLHNGSISVDSVEGEYCRFEFYIPYIK